MIRTAFLVLLVAGSAAGQPSLDAELDRARERYEPAATRGLPEVDRLAAEAGEHLRGGHQSQAIATLDRAAGLANQSGATGRAFELSLAAAELQRAGGESLDAARRFRDAALTNPRDPRAATAHHTACETFARGLTTTVSEAVLDDYDALLAQHAATWPDAPTAVSARAGRLRLLAKRRRWAELRERLLPIGPDAAQLEAKQALLVAAHRGLLSEAMGRAAFFAAREDLEPIVLGAPPRWPDIWSETQRAACLVLGRSALEQSAGDIDRARTLLRMAIRGRPTPDEAWQQRATSVLIVAALSADDERAAGEWMRSLNPSFDKRWSRLLRTTQERVEARPADRLNEADRLLASIRVLSGDGSATTGQQAAALADSGQDAEARRLYGRLAEERPDDRGVQTTYAKLLGETDAAADHEAALAIWRRLESRSERTTTEWFDARLGRLRMLVALGRKEQATKLLRLTRLLAPSLGGAERAAEFAAVEQSFGAVE